MINIPSKIKTFLKQLEEDGHEAYIVGGAVRDIHMGIEPKDWDIATSAIPGQIKATFMYDNVKQIDASFPVVTVDGIEIATFREDFYEDGKTVETKPIKNLITDLSRRDLTINAMAMDKEGNIIDPFGGQEDLKNKVIRFVGEDGDLLNAEERINEDPCRMIRACRFLACIDGKFTDDTLTGLIHKNGQIVYVAPERIRLELMKTMQYPKASKFFKALLEIGILKNILPGLDATYDLDGGPYHGETVFEHNMLAGDLLWQHFPQQCKENPMFRLTAYLHDIGKSQPNFVDGIIHFYEHHVIGAEMVRNDLDALKFTTDEIKYAANLILVHMRGGLKISPKSTRKILRTFADLGVDWKEWLSLKVVDRSANVSRTPFTPGEVAKLARKFLHELEPPEDKPKPIFRMKDLAMSGTQIQKILGIGPSMLIGVILEFLMQQVIADPSLNTYNQLKKLMIGKKKRKLK